MQSDFGRVAYRTGYFARVCPQGGGDRGGRGDRDGGSYGRGGGRDKCYKCNCKSGHFAREFKEEKDRCYHCNEVRHITRSPSEPSCFNCSKTGHIARNCPEGSTKSCYVYGKTVHISGDCDQSDGSSNR